MSLFNRLFGKQFEKRKEPDIKFGRYSDSFKTKEQFDTWDLALEKFEQENYLDAYRYFFQYLKDENEENIKISESKGEIRFEIYQGSLILRGLANIRIVKVEAKIAHSSALNIDLMHRLLEQNFSLKYSRFALDDKNNIVITFQTSVLDGSPYKLYYALKEVATSADKQDDLLLDEFSNLYSVDTDHLKALPPAEKKAKYNFIVKEIQTVFEHIDKNKNRKDQYPGGIAYLLLDLIYKLDYLTRPEGFMMETLERSHRQYFEKDGKTAAEKNEKLCIEFQKLLERPKEEYFKEMYNVVSTFGITNPVNHDRLVGFIDGELNNMTWYNENNYSEIALAIPGYIVGGCLFNHTLPKPDKDFLHLYYEIMEPEYFAQLGFTLKYRKGQILNEKEIKRAIKKLSQYHIKEYPDLAPNVEMLSFTTLVSFSNTYLMMIRDIDLTQAY